MKRPSQRASTAGEPSNDARDTNLALVLQGGGALGAYQGGVYEALQEHEFFPDWIVGTSIGAINGAIIAGNAPEDRLDRLKEFWECMSEPNLWDIAGLGDISPALYSKTSILQSLLLGVRGMFRPRPWPTLQGGGPTGQSPSIYDTKPLRDSLERLVDFERISRQSIRLSVSAVHVTSGRRVFFDSAERRLTVDHILASGAMPPGFPAVRIDGELYWDGGVYANTPLDVVLEGWKGLNALCFMVDLWDPRGREPQSIAEVETRHKQLGYTSRSRQHIEDVRAIHELRNTLRSICKRLPQELRDEEDIANLAAELGDETAMHIQLIGYPQEDKALEYKDIDFSTERTRQRWRQGYRDAETMLERASWRGSGAPSGVIVHDQPSRPD